VLSEAVGYRRQRLPSSARSWRLLRRRPERNGELCAAYLPSRAESVCADHAWSPELPGHDLWSGIGITCMSAGTLISSSVKQATFQSTAPVVTTATGVPGVSDEDETLSKAIAASLSERPEPTALAVGGTAGPSAAAAEPVALDVHSPDDYNFEEHMQQAVAHSLGLPDGGTAAAGLASVTQHSAQADKGKAELLVEASQSTGMTRSTLEPTLERILHAWLVMCSECYSMARLCPAPLPLMSSG
jgi:hypothetical protein